MITQTLISLTWRIALFRAGSRLTAKKGHVKKQMLKTGRFGTAGRSDLVWSGLLCLSRFLPHPVPVPRFANFFAFSRALFVFSTRNRGSGGENWREVDKRRSSRKNRQ
jgi:hypothetical protein